MDGFYNNEEKLEMYDTLYFNNLIKIFETKN